MSLLMKALEKAAKDRVEARSEPAAAAPAGAPKSELTLEPMTAEAPASAARAEAPAGSAAAPHSAASASAREQAKAASVLQAGSRVSGEVAVRARAQPVLVVGTIAALIAIGFGTYVYLQMFHPSLFYGQPVAKPPASPLSQQPAPPPPPRARPVVKRRRAEPAAAAPAAPAPKAPRDTIVVSRGSAAPAVSPLLTEAYTALQSGGLDAAQSAYEQLLRAEPRNIDAPLGMAASATREATNDMATRRERGRLDIKPRTA